MNIRVLGVLVLFKESAKKIAEAHHYLVTVIQVGVRNSPGVDSEEKYVDCHVAS